jgi:hypothetical protein
MTFYINGRCWPKVLVPRWSHQRPLFQKTRRLNLHRRRVRRYRQVFLKPFIRDHSCQDRIQIFSIRKTFEKNRRTRRNRRQPLRCMGSRCDESVNSATGCWPTLEATPELGAGNSQSRPERPPPEQSQARDGCPHGGANGGTPGYSRALRPGGSVSIQLGTSGMKIELECG